MSSDRTPKARYAVSDQPQLKRELRLIDLVLFNVVATLGPQLIPAFGYVGPVAIPLHMAAALFFFVPCALAVATLSREFPGEGGFYIWTKQAFGDQHAFVCGWSWWLSVLLYLPGLVLIGVGTATEAAGKIGAGLVDDGRWQAGFALFVLWFTVGANILGLRVSKWLSNVSGTVIYLSGGMILLAGAAVWLKQGSATSLRFGSSWNLNSVSLWAQIAFAYTGLELGSLLGAEIRNPEKTIPRAVWISAAATTLGYIAGSLSLMLVLAPGEINPIRGMAQVASAAGTKLGIASFGTLTAALLFVGILGKVSTWGGGAARLPFTVGVDGSFPAVFTRLHHKWRTPWAALLIQGVVCSFFLVWALAGETVRNGWQLLMDMEILVTFIPFFYIFLTAWKFGRKWSSASGLGVTVIAMGFALVPPENSSSIRLFETKTIGGSVLSVGLGWLIFELGKRRRTNNVGRAGF